MIDSIQEKISFNEFCREMTGMSLKELNCWYEKQSKNIKN